MPSASLVSPTTEPNTGLRGTGVAGYSSLYEKFQTRVPAGGAAASGAPGAGYTAVSPVWRLNSGSGEEPGDSRRASDAFAATESARIVLTTPHPESGAPFRPSRAAPAIDAVVHSVLRPSTGSGDQLSVPGRGYSTLVFSDDTRGKAAQVAQRAPGGPAGPSVPDFFAYNRQTRGYHYLKPEVAGFLQQAHREASTHERSVQQRSVGSAAGVRGSVPVSVSA